MTVWCHCYKYMIYMKYVYYLHLRAVFPCFNALVPSFLKCSCDIWLNVGLRPITSKPVLASPKFLFALDPVSTIN
jgi:hypothetical protein